MASRRSASDVQDDMNMLEAHLKASFYMFFIHPFVELKSKVTSRFGRA